MKLNLTRTIFRFQDKQGREYIAAINLNTWDNTWIWDVSKQGKFIGRIQEVRGRQFVNETRAKQIIVEAENAFKAQCKGTDS